VYPHQLERLTEALERDGLDALVATSPENVLYVSEFRSPAQALDRSLPVLAVFTRRGAALVVPALDVGAATVDRPDVEVHAYGALPLGESDSRDTTARRVLERARRAVGTPADALAAALGALGVTTGRVGLDEGGLTPGGWRRLVEALGAGRVGDGTVALARARAVKAPYEIESLERSLGVAEQALNAVVQMLKPGVTEREAAALLTREVVAGGAAPARVVVAFGDRTAFPGVIPAERALRRGDLVRLEVGSTFRGYWAHVARTAVMGAPGPRHDEVCAAVETGVEAAVDAMTIGAVPARIRDAAVAAVREAGLPAYDAPDVGHGIGLEAREHPWLARDDETPLEAGMVLSVEAAYHEPGWAGVSLRDTVLVARTGPRVMNRSVRGLVVLD
jgi:Xaa-Pro aminopeptidase